MISQHKSPNETLKEESIKSFKELINDKAKNSSNNSSNSNNISAFLSYLLLNNRHLYNHYVNYLQSELSPKFDTNFSRTHAKN